MPLGQVELNIVIVLKKTATFTVSVDDQFKVCVVNTEQSSHLFARLLMTKLQRVQDPTGLPHNLVALDAKTLNTQQMTKQ